MKPSTRIVWLAIFAPNIIPAAAQTSTICNPLAGTCPADPALGRSINIDFTRGASGEFLPVGSGPTYDSNGASFAVAKSGDSPGLNSKWFMMFGRVEIVLKAAPGTGIVSTVVLQSDDLDEIDFEWLGADSAQVQSNYFGKGHHETHDRGAFHANPGSQGDFHKYTIDWTADQIVWQIDGVTVRALTPSSATQGQYPQTPMQLKLGIWAAGDTALNEPGTVSWAGGAVNYANGPFVLQIKSITATDYSTGTHYTYGDNSGSWQSIRSDGGTVNAHNNGNAAAGANAPAVTAVSNGAPMPFEGTHRGSSSYSTPNIYPWVASPTTLQTAGGVATSYPGLPSGWTVTSSGKVVPPSAASLTSQLAPSTSPSPASPSASPLAPGVGYEVVTAYNQQGFQTTVTEPSGWATATKTYDEQGFLILPPPPGATSSTGLRVVAADQKVPAAAQSATPTLKLVGGATTGVGGRIELTGLKIACLFLIGIVML